MIPTRNIYFMLSYAFSALRGRGYASLASEDFDHADDLLAAILTRGIDQQVRRGLRRDYVPIEEETSSPKGKVDISASIKQRSLSRRTLVCGHDEFTENNALNQMLKTTGVRLLRRDLEQKQRTELRRAIARLNTVDAVDPASIDWHRRYDRSTRTYEMLSSVCHMALFGRIHDNVIGHNKVEAFDEETMSHLYERFLLEYFRVEHAGKLTATAPYVPWVLDDDNDSLLPAMRTDITLERASGPTKNVLIIDAKYYSNTLQSRFGKRTIHSGNLYQIFSYVKNREEALRRDEVDHKVSGMLLYAGTDEDVQPNETYRMSGNAISVRTLDLSGPFSSVRAQLDQIAQGFIA